MSVEAIKNRLVEILHVSGVRRVYDDYPSVVPANSDLPAIIIGRAEPFLDTSVATNDQISYQWHFEILFLYAAIGQEVVSQWDAGIEPFPRRLMDAISANLTLNLPMTHTQLSGSFSAGVINYRSADYWGFRWNLTVTELIFTPFAP